MILDPRVLIKPYGRTFLDSLPRCPRVVESPRFANRRAEAMRTFAGRQECQAHEG